MSMAATRTLIRLVDRNPSISAAEIASELVPPPQFEHASFESYRPDPDYPSRAVIDAWWGPIPDERFPGTRRTCEGEVEIVGYDGKRLVLAGEAKWSKGPEDGAALSQLLRTAIHIPGYDERRTRLVLYARDGFTEDLRARAEAQGVILRTVDDLFA